MTKPVQPPTVEELIAKARAGDEGAREKLFQWCMPAMRDWATRLVGKKQPGIARPSDIMQDAALQAVRGFASFRGDTYSEWMAWLMAIVENTAAGAYRHAGRQKRDGRNEVRLDAPENEHVPAQQTSPSQAAAEEERWHQLLSAIHDLPPEQGKAIWHCQLQKRRVAEAAIRMNTTETAIASLLQRGIATLRKRFSSESDHPAGMGTTSSQELAAAALLDYLRRRDSGETIDLEAFIAEYPSCSNELRALITWGTQIEALDVKKDLEGDG